MATTTINRVRPGASRSTSTPLPLLARALVLAVLCSQLSSLATGSPISSIPASAPGFEAGDVAPAPASWVDTDPTKPSLPDSEDEEWDLKYEGPTSSSEETPRTDVDGIGSAIEKGMDSYDAGASASEIIPSPPANTNSQTPSSFLQIPTLPSTILTRWSNILAPIPILYILLLSTVAALVFVLVKVRRWERSGMLRGWREEMEMEMQSGLGGTRGGGKGEREFEVDGLGVN